MISKKFNISHLSDIEISLRWEGYFVPRETGVHALGVSGMNSVRFWFEGKMMEDFSNIYEPEDVYFNFDLKEGQPYHIKIEMYSPPGDVYQHQLIFSEPDPRMRERAVEAAKKSDLVILNLGLSSKLEGEEHRVHVEGFNKGDRVSLDLPAVQEELLKSIHETGKPVVLVLYSGSAVSINYAMENLPAILLAWYPGQAAGKAITDVLFGKESPSGKLPVTFYKDVNDLPPFEDYSMEGRTYRYFRKEPLVPFGFGLSYTTFSYTSIMIERDKIKPEEGLSIKVEVSNKGKLDGEEVVQVYIKALEPSFATPVYSLKAFKRVKLAAGQTRQVGFTLDQTAFEVYNDEGMAINEAGKFKIFAGGSSPSPRSLNLGASKWVEKDVLVSG
jgi:beta-glucosidase